MAASTSSTLSIGAVDGSNKKALTNAATNLFQLAIPDLTNAGGFVEYTIFATDGTDVQSLSGTVTFAAVAAAGAITSSAVDTGTITDSNTDTSTLSATAVTTGTLTATWTGVDLGGNLLAIQVTPATSLAFTIYNITYSITNNSTAVITIF